MTLKSEKEPSSWNRAWWECAPSGLLGRSLGPAWRNTASHGEARCYTEKCKIYNATGTKWTGSSPHSAETIQVVGHTMTRNSDEANTTARILATKTALSSMRKYLTRTQGPAWRRVRTLHTTIGPVAAWEQQPKERHQQQPTDYNDYGERWWGRH